ncbi:MAG: HIRAN domain-containing protein [Clostridia bacterium]
MREEQLQKPQEPLLAGYFNPQAFTQKRKRMLVLKTGIAGMEFCFDRNQEALLQKQASLVPGTELRLFREPENERDEWAIAVYTTDDEMIGYITRFKNETIARMMDQGKTFVAYVDAPEQEAQEEEQVGHRRKGTTEDDRLPFSVFLEE